MSRSEREAKMKALHGDKYGALVISEMGGPKKDRKKELNSQINRHIIDSYEDGTLVEAIKKSYEGGTLGEYQGGSIFGRINPMTSAGGNRMTPVQGQAGTMAPINSRFSGVGQRGEMPRQQAGQYGYSNSGASGSRGGPRQSMGLGSYRTRGQRSQVGSPPQERQVQEALARSQRAQDSMRREYPQYQMPGGGGGFGKPSMPSMQAPSLPMSPGLGAPNPYAPIQMNPIQMGAAPMGGTAMRLPATMLGGYEEGSLSSIIEKALSNPDSGPKTPDLRKFGPVAASTFPLTAGSLAAAKLRGLEVEETPEGAYVIERPVSYDPFYPRSGQTPEGGWARTLGEAIWMEPELPEEMREGAYRHELGHVSQGRDLGLGFPIANAVDQGLAAAEGIDPQDAYFERTANRRGDELLDEPRSRAMRRR